MPPRLREVAKANGLECEIWDQARLEHERCGSLLAVARGSSRPPRLVILRYTGTKTDAPMLALVGKGVTFDSGGLSLKPTDSMLTMKCDMAGAATVLGAMQAIARLKLPINVVGLMGLVENMTGPAAFKLGDVLTARSGRTIEVHNTDAEGRLVLADVLNVALDQKPAKIIDLATLTGACVVALGTETVGAMTNNQPWCDAILEAARRVGEPIWQLAHDAGNLRRANQKRSGRHQKRRRRPLGRRDHRRQIPRAIRRRRALDASRHRRPSLPGKTQALARRRRHRLHAPHPGRSRARLEVTSICSVRKCCFKSSNVVLVIL